MENNLKEALLVELLEADLSAEKKSALLINLVKNDVTQNDLLEYQTLRAAIKDSDPSDVLLPEIDEQALEARIMNVIKTTPERKTYKVTTLDHLIAKSKNDRYQ